ncbi:hypothetical protein EB001_25910 [bacterium]|nr:hypothetical protein [bacterium]
MARNNKSINVKIATTKVIKALETKLAQIQKDKANQATNEERYTKAHEKWSKDVAKLALNAINKAENLSANLRYNGMINVEFNLPKGAIDLPMVDEIENAIRILKMTDEETVSTSTYNSIARYL